MHKTKIRIKWREKKSSSSGKIKPTTYPQIRGLRKWKCKFFFYHFVRLCARFVPVRFVFCERSFVIAYWFLKLKIYFIVFCVSNDARFDGMMVMHANKFCELCIQISLVGIVCVSGSVRCTCHFRYSKQISIKKEKWNCFVVLVVCMCVFVCVCMCVASLRKELKNM